MGKYVVGKVSELPPSSRRIVRVNGREIGVFNVKGKYYALRNVCPHQSAPLCLGELTGLAVSDEPGEIEWTREGEILRCPWHGWEFDISNGSTIFQSKARVKTYEVQVEKAALARLIEGVETYPVTVEDEVVILEY
ncbi:MAG: Rieske (2Fe-2S) protein [Chloroflexota bacterium]|nr:Rieske (2Fe-2S) protein [Chloroflexota bacterium]MYE26145.1 Rieske (2Fe-2S) protein [Chloroflexota bacterium]